MLIRRLAVLSLLSFMLARPASAKSPGILLTITEASLSQWTFEWSGDEAVTVGPGQPLRFSWSADAETHGATITGYRFGWDVVDIDDARVKRLILCCGKIYYKLHEVRQKKYDYSTAIVRVEQLYPFPRVDLKAIHDRYPALENLVWCQDEPRNQGAFREFKSRLNETFAPLQVQYAGRSSSASPAVGYMALHLEQETNLVTEAFEAEFSAKLD